MGYPNADILARYFPGEDTAILDRKEALFRDSLAARVEPVAGIHALLDWAETNAVGCAVVTNAPRPNAAAMLAAASLSHRLPTVVIGEECRRPKPDPEPYAAAMRSLGATPSRSIAFEDSRSGLRAARGSGAYVFGITTGLGASELLAAGAHAVIADFTDPALWAHLDRLGSQGA
jgi:HAD superfamily hydrolase (TIGR01509 family)